MAGRSASGSTIRTLTLASETALVYNGVISGPGGLTVVGIAGVDQQFQSILDISAPATYQGTTTINSAVGQVNSGTAGVNGAVVVNVLPTTTVLNLINNGAWNIDSASIQPDRRRLDRRRDGKVRHNQPNDCGDESYD